ncbi:hypothetical protein KCP77_14695 [Salmonella enterica subsp. enterica]|nr:hypothetical protein KCP77_14695 [Salmonella enterica subsp. enterica]
MTGLLSQSHMVSGQEPTLLYPDSLISIVIAMCLPGRGVNARERLSLALHQAAYWFYRATEFMR